MPTYLPTARSYGDDRTPIEIAPAVRDRLRQLLLRTVQIDDIRESYLFKGVGYSAFIDWALDVCEARIENAQSK